MGRSRRWRRRSLRSERSRMTTSQALSQPPLPAVAVPVTVTAKTKNYRLREVERKVVFVVRVYHFDGTRDRETARSAIVKELERAQQGFDKNCDSIKGSIGRPTIYDRSMPSSQSMIWKVYKIFQPLTGFDLTNDSPNY
jgi:hypothetical protein